MFHLHFTFAKHNVLANFNKNQTTKHAQRRTPCEISPFMQLERRKTPRDFSSGKVPREALLSCAIYVQKMKIFDCAI